MSASYQRNVGFRREEVGVGPAASHGLILRQPEQRRNECDLVEQAAGAGVFGAHVPGDLQIVLHQRPLLIRQLTELLLQTVCGPGIVEIEPKAEYEIAHLILVTALKEVDVLRRAVRVSLKWVLGQEAAVPFRPYAQLEHIRRGDKVLDLDLLQVRDGFAAQQLHHLIRTGDGLLRGAREHGRAALGDDAVEVLMGALHQRQQGHAGAARGFAEDGHVVGIAAEARDVLMDPLERHHLIHQAQVLGVRIVRAVRQVGQVEKAEHPDPVLDGGHDDVRVLLHEIVAIVGRVHRAALFKRAAMDPDHHRLFPRAGIIRLPDVQVQAVLPLHVEGRAFVDALPLAGRFSDVIRLVDAVVPGIFHRGLPAVFPHGLLAHIGDALVRDDVVRPLADEGAVDALDRQRLVIVVVGDRLVLAVSGHHFRLPLLRRYELVEALGPCRDDMGVTADHRQRQRHCQKCENNPVFH